MEKIFENKPERKIKVIQFGGGVFLRGFFDVMLQKMNDTGVFDGNAVIVRSKTEGEDPLAKQNFVYTHIARDGGYTEKTLVNSISFSVSAANEYERFLGLAENKDTEVIVSNTTESGIVYEKCQRLKGECPKTYPAKLTELLYRRFSSGNSGMLIIPCELIENNGTVLKNTVLRHSSDWQLGKNFEGWLDSECSFRNTLVDRIVSGKTSEKPEFPYNDELVNTSEYFHLFVIDGKEDERLPLSRAGINVKWVPSVAPYRNIKVRILNGAHTSMIPYALLSGIETVGDCLKNGTLRKHLENCLDEIIRSMDGDEKEEREYADEVIKRFENPYIRHLCASIALNSVSKFRVRVLPSILSYKKKYGVYPENLVFSLYKLIEFYKYGSPSDDQSVIEKMKKGNYREILSDTSLFGVDISETAEEMEKYDNRRKG